MNRQRGQPADRRCAGTRRLVWRCLAAAAAVTALTAAAPAPSATPGSLGGSGRFGLSAAPDSQGRIAPYITLTVAAGYSATAAVVVSNLGDTTEELKIGRAIGVTAGNGATAYRPAPRRCRDPGCWLSGLPRLVTLPAHAREILNFTVRVPARAAHGQYLAGISAAPAAKPRSVKVGSNGKATARAIIVEEVTVGVAVTVGQLPKLSTRLQIPAVLGTTEGPVARLNIRLENTGQTFANGTGRASCTSAGRGHTYTVYASTVLPHDHALIAVNAPGLPEGATMPCKVWIHYGRHQTVSWAGLVTVPGPPNFRIVHTGHGTYSAVPRTGVPVWAIALISIGALILAGIGALLFRSR